MVDLIGWGQGLIQSYGLLGLFFIVLITSASVIVAVPGWMFVIIAGYFYHPLAVALVAAVAGTLGEYTSYLLGRGGNYIIEKKKIANLEKIEGWFKKYGFILFPIFAAGPLPFDILGIIAGTLKYDVWKFFLGTFIGKLIKGLVLAYMGYAGLAILGP